MKASSTRIPADGTVIIGSLSDATQSRLTEAVSGRLSKISDAPPTLVVESKADDPRALCQRVNQVVGDEAVVAPLLTDEEGNRLFPTGQLQVRFERPPPEDQLKQVAERHKLDLAGRNKWAAQQAVFSIRPEDSRYLPDIAAELTKEEGVAAVWPDVKAAFRRE